jgi:hypothetical protein
VASLAFSGVLYRKCPAAIVWTGRRLVEDVQDHIPEQNRVVAIDAPTMTAGNLPEYSS